MKMPARGFTLIELAMVLTIIGLMLGGLLLPISAQMDQRNYAETRKAMNDIRDALMGYGIVHGYLPCPAVSVNDGSEDRAAGGACNKRAGFLPWSQLGVPKLDSWGHLYRYSVTPGFSDSVTRASLTTSADITVKTRDTAGSLINLSNTGIISAMVVSYGKNGRWGYADSGIQAADTSATNADEDTNGGGTTAFVSREYTGNTTGGGGEFDDIAVWVPSGLYLNRMVAAGQLP